MDNQISVLEDLKETAQKMSGWLKFIGIMNIIWGSLSALSIVGIIIAWLPIWLGVILLQASSSATLANTKDDPQSLVMMMNKLRMFFVIEGALIIVTLAFMGIGLIVMTTMLPELLETVEGYYL